MNLISLWAAETCWPCLQADQAEGTEVHQDTAAVQRGLDAVMAGLSCNHVPSAIQTAFQVGDAGFAGPLAHALRDLNQQASKLLEVLLQPNF